MFAFLRSKTNLVFFICEANPLCLSCGKIFLSQTNIFYFVKEY